jgi:(p)ppGpp synthase/HD superfamily hydrolase
MSNLVQRAKDLAHRAHAGQVDKAGRPYVEHVARVAAAVSDDPEAEAVAWLHDVLEDCEARFKNALLTDFHVGIFRAVMALTRYKGVSERKYYDDIRRYPIALRVKLADIADNSDESRLALLDEKTAARLRRKYAKALKALGNG